jgi:hypothetical protein
MAAAQLIQDVTEARANLDSAIDEGVFLDELDGGYCG